MKKGDDVVCINNYGNTGLEVGKIYKIIGTQESLNWLVVKDSFGSLNSFSSSRFIPLQRHRENQLNKIL